MPRLRTIIVYLLCLAPLTGEVMRNAGAAEPTAETELGVLVGAAFESNPDIRAARAKWRQTIERLPLETGLEDPTLTFSYFLENVETRVGPQEYSVGASQKFPFPGTLRQKGRVVAKEVEIAEIQYERVVRDTIADLKIAVYELAYLDGAVEVTEHNQELLREILGFAQARHADGGAGLNDVFRAESQLAQLDYDLITLRELRAVQSSVVNAILDRPANDAIGRIAAPIQESATCSVEALDELSMQRSQEIRLAELGVEKSEEGIKLAQKLNLPKFSIGLNHIGTGEAIDRSIDDSGHDPLVVTGGVSVPLWFKKNQARTRYAEEEKQVAGARVESVRNATRVALRKTFFRVENARRLVTLYRDHLIPEADRSMEIAEEWNREGRGSVSEILETQSVWLNFNLAFLRARIDHAQALTELERLAGGSLTPVLALEQKP